MTILISPILSTARRIDHPRLLTAESSVTVIITQTAQAEVDIPYRLHCLCAVPSKVEREIEKSRANQRESNFGKLVREVLSNANMIDGLGRRWLRWASPRYLLAFALPRKHHKVSPPWPERDAANLDQSKD